MQLESARSPLSRKETPHAHPYPGRRRIPRVADRDAVLRTAATRCTSSTTISGAEPTRRSAPTPWSRSSVASGRGRGLEGGLRQGDRRHRGRPRRVGPTSGPVPRLPARGDRALRGDALGPVLDARSRPRGVHPAEQRREHAERPVGDARVRARLPSREARHDGRVRDAEHRHRGGLSRHRAQRAEGDDPVSEAARAACITSRRSTTPTTSTSRAGCGASVRPT